MANNKIHYANANDEGFKFILPPMDENETNGGLIRHSEQGHLVTIVGRGGTGKSILALQIISQLFEDAKNTYKKAGEDWPDDRPHAAFYFTLEATPLELAVQMKGFE